MVLTEYLPTLQCSVEMFSYSIGFCQLKPGLGAGLRVVELLKNSQGQIQ